MHMATLQHLHPPSREPAVACVTAAPQASQLETAGQLDWPGEQQPATSRSTMSTVACEGSCCVLETVWKRFMFSAHVQAINGRIKQSVDRANFWQGRPVAASLNGMFFCKCTFHDSRKGDRNTSPATLARRSRCHSRCSVNGHPAINEETTDDRNIVHGVLTVIWQALLKLHRTVC